MFIFPNKIAFIFLKVVPISANSVDPDEMPHFAAFHLGLHFLPKYAYTSSSGPLVRGRFNM